MGQWIDVQSMVVARTAIGGLRESPSAGTIPPSVSWHGLARAVLAGVLVISSGRRLEESGARGETGRVGAR
jgi:hypothetical protein